MNIYVCILYCVFAYLLFSCKVESPSGDDRAILSVMYHSAPEEEDDIDSVTSLDNLNIDLYEKKKSVAVEEACTPKNSSDLIKTLQVHFVDDTTNISQPEKKKQIALTEIIDKKAVFGSKISPMLPKSLDLGCNRQNKIQSSEVTIEMAAVKKYAHDIREMKFILRNLKYTKEIPSILVAYVNYTVHTLDCSRKNLKLKKVGDYREQLRPYQGDEIWDFGSADYESIAEAAHDNYVHNIFPYKVKVLINSEEKYVFPSNMFGVSWDYKHAVDFVVQLNSKGREYLNGKRKEYGYACSS